MLTVLLQAGKGGGMGAAFGGGSSSGTVFGGSGAGNFLKKLTVGAACVFVFTSMTLAYLSSSSGSDALKEYSAQQRRNAELKRKQHDQGAEADPAGAAIPGVPAEGDVAPQIDEPGAPTGEPAPEELIPTTGEGAALTEKPVDEVPAAPAPTPAPAAPAPTPAPAP
jgi:preprotein translocase subunit SecG